MGECSSSKEELLNGLTDCEIKLDIVRGACLCATEPLLVTDVVPAVWAVFANLSAWLLRIGDQRVARLIGLSVLRAVTDTACPLLDHLLERMPGLCALVCEL